MGEQTIIPPTQSATRPVYIGPYASVIARFIAMLIDWIIVFAILFLLFIPLFILSLLGALFVSPILGLFGIALSPSFMGLLVFAHWIYFATMESSARGATYGKRLMGLRVVTEHGDKLSFARASVRYFAKLVSAIPMMLGFFMAFFTNRKQALHDLIAECLVVKI